MKVIFVIVSMAGGGAERVISILANQFVKQNINVTIMMTAGDEVAYQLDGRINLVHIGGTSGGSFVKRVKRIFRMRKVLKAQKDAIIISFGPGTSFFAVMAGLFLPNRFIISERNDPAACPYPRLRNLIYRRARHLVFQTEAAAECFPPSLKKRGVVIGNPLDEAAKIPKRDENSTEHKFEIAAVGRLEPQKNYPLLLEAFAMFANSINCECNNAYHLTIYGNGSHLTELQQYADRLGIGEKVTFAGFTSDVMSRIKNSAMYILSSDYEGISNSLLEAMSIGLPVIATDCPIGGSALLIQPNINGILVPVGDVNALADAMIDMAEDKARAARLGEEATKVRELYSASSIAEQWLAVISKYREQ